MDPSPPANPAPAAGGALRRLGSLYARLPRWLRIGGVVAAMLVVAGGLALWFLVARGLPDAASLASYEPPLPSTVRTIDGRPFYTFARERRIFLPYEEIPPHVVQAFISAEDKTFFEHKGLDYVGILSAVLTNLRNMGDRRPVGASTITQQVAKNLLLTNELSIARKLREAILARRIEEQFSKQQILELYLNEIFLGRNSYGVEAASQAYFGKTTADLSVGEAAFLAALPKAPSNYNPLTHYDRAVTRRNYVLTEMAANGYIDAATAEALQRAPLVTGHYRPGVIANRNDGLGGYFVEEVRRQLIGRFGEDAKRGPHSVYAGGLWVRTTLDPVIQAAAERALRDGLVRYDRLRGWRGPEGRIDLGPGWENRLAQLNLGTGYPEWRAAVVLGRSAGGFDLGFSDGSHGRMENAGADFAGGGGPAWQQLRAGDVVPVARSGAGYALRQIPKISGAMVVEETATGRILAMVGGFDIRQSSFNRATQALRQPGSSFKPFVYAAGIDSGLTPASIVADAPYCVFQTARLGTKCFRNFGGGYAGPRTMRWGLEQSRNLMTIRIGNHAGMDNVVKLASTLGIGRYPPNLAIALGAGETTPARLVNAYAMLLNGGRRVEPVLFDLVQDRHGRVIYRADPRVCQGCNAARWNGQPMPAPADQRQIAMDPRTAYQVTHMLEGVIERGTAHTLASLGIPIAGKTGTTTGPRDVWFVGGTPHFVAGLYVGYDTPQNLGGWMQGGTFAAPIWKAFYQQAFKDRPQPPDPFLAPAGIRMVRIDRRSGRRVYGVWPSDAALSPVIWEAFKPDSEPRRIARPAVETFDRAAGAPVRTDSDFLRSSGGIY
jgi:penicillin-binding protein 1A